MMYKNKKFTVVYNIVFAKCKQAAMELKGAFLQI